ncbi:hypothetical protein D3C81_858800 [compost metagenome]
MAALQGPRQDLGVGRAATGIESLDEAGTQAAQERPGDALPGQFALGDEAEPGRQRRAERQSVEVAGVVGDQHAHLAAVQTPQTVDPQRHPDQMQEAACRPPRQTPAPGRARQ